MANRYKRRWYVVYRIGEGEPDYMISAVSDKVVKKWARKLLFPYRIVVAKTWELAKVMSGSPSRLPYAESTAPNNWFMASEYCRTSVIIFG